MGARCAASHRDCRAMNSGGNDQVGVITAIYEEPTIYRGILEINSNEEKHGTKGIKQRRACTCVCVCERRRNDQLISTEKKEENRRE